MELFWYKFGMLIGILASSVILAFVPFMLKKIEPSIKKKLLSYGNAFAGGVFLAIGFTHLLPEATELTYHAFEGIEFPLSYVLRCVLSGSIALTINLAWQGSFWCSS